ncbi:MAG: hypothetical protein U1E92_07695 [Moraxella osloensis]
MMRCQWKFNDLNPSNTPFSIWLAVGAVAGREMLLAMQAMKCQYNLPMTIVASHRQPRPEILAVPI